MLKIRSLLFWPLWWRIQSSNQLPPTSKAVCSAVFSSLWKILCGDGCLSLSSIWSVITYWSKPSVRALLQFKELQTVCKTSSLLSWNGNAAVELVFSWSCISPNRTMEQCQTAEMNKANVFTDKWWSWALMEDLMSWEQNYNGDQTLKSTFTSIPGLNVASVAVHTIIN